MPIQRLMLSQEEKALIDRAVHHADTCRSCTYPSGTIAHVHGCTVGIHLYVKMANLLRENGYGLDKPARIPKEPQY